MSTSGVAADEPVLTIDWGATVPESGDVVDGRVRVSAGPTGGTFRLASIDVPDLGRTGYSITGEVRYDDVEADGYLEMWSIFKDGSRYFSRTLASDGPMQSLTGSSEGRPFQLPFLLDGAAPPERLEVNVVLPGSGTVELGLLTLARLDGAAGSADTVSDGAWIPDRQLGLLGAVLGSTIGMLGAMVGVLASRQRARGLVLTTMTIATAVGLVMLVASVLAVAAGQPARVVYFLFLPGALLAGVFGLLLPRVRRAYADAELRRMRAFDRG